MLRQVAGSLGCTRGLQEAASVRGFAQLCSLFPDAGVKQHRQVSAENLVEYGEVSGNPDDVKAKVYIYAPAKTASQQGQAKTFGKQNNKPPWKIEFETKAKWQNPLIGWTSTADPYEHVGRSAMNFATKEEAVIFAEKHGWAYDVKEPHVRRPDRLRRFAGYGDNFSVKRAGYPVGGLRSESDDAPKSSKPAPAGAEPAATPKVPKEKAPKKASKSKTAA